MKPENNESAAKSVWTPEQDAYFTKLKTDPVTSKLKPQEIQNLFEEKFNTGRSLESLKQRWFKVLKFAVVELNADQVLSPLCQHVFSYWLLTTWCNALHVFCVPVWCITTEFKD